MHISSLKETYCQSQPPPPRLTMFPFQHLTLILMSCHLFWGWANSICAAQAADGEWNQSAIKKSKSDVQYVLQLLLFFRLLYIPCHVSFPCTVCQLHQFYCLAASFTFIFLCILKLLHGLDLPRFYFYNKVSVPKH